MHVIVIPILSDNYTYLLVEGAKALCVDPGEADPIIAMLSQHQLELGGILVTHTHADHIHGLRALLRHAPCRLAAPTDLHSETVTIPLQVDFPLDLGGIALRALATPGHCPNHFAFYAPGILFTGDALFTGGCGRLLGGTARQLWASLQRLSALPQDTAVYGGHDYAEANLRFGLSILPDDPHLKQALGLARDRAAAGQATVPSLLGDEMRANIFLRSADADVAQAVGMPGKEALDVFTELRRRKDRW